MNRKIQIYLFILSLLLLVTNKAYAASCRGEPTRYEIGDNVEYKYRAKIGVICTRSSRGGLNGFLGLEILEYPKASMEIITRPYEFAFRINKIGNYKLRYRYKMVNRYGKEGYVNFIMNLEAVEKSW